MYVLLKTYSILLGIWIVLKFQTIMCTWSSSVNPELIKVTPSQETAEKIPHELPRRLFKKAKTHEFYNGQK